MKSSEGTRLRSIVIVTMILTGAFFVLQSGSVSAAQAGDYTYSVIDGSAIISAYTGAGGAITIPSTVGGYQVTGIGAYAFSSAAGFSVTSAVIPDSVTRIDVYAFDGCSSLTSVNLGKGLLTIGNGAFEHCTKLSSVTIPNSVTAIGSWAFYTCTGITTLSLGSGLTSIGDYAFDGCAALGSLTIPNNVVSIGTSAFEGCSSLSTVTISNKVHTIGSFAFYDCNALTTVTIGSGVTSIGSSAFYGCDHLTSITFQGLVAPTVGSYWLPLNSYIVRGHAYAASNFPAPGNTFNALMMDANIAPVIPEAPTSLSAAVGDVRVLLTWSSPSPGGAPIGDFRIYRGTTSAGKTYLGNTGSGGVLTFTDTGLTNGVTYYYQVAAVNSYGEGPRSAEISARPAVSLSAPRDLQVTAGDSQATLSWTVPSSIGENPIDYYIVYQDGVDVRHPTATSATITGLNNGQAYSYAVAAHNSAGSGPSTSAVIANPVTSKTVPDVPTGVTAVPGNGQAMLSWTAPINNGGAAIDYYLVLVDGIARTDHYITTSATITGLTNGRQYSLTVSAHNIIGTSMQSGAVTATPLAPVTVAGMPRNMTAMPGDGLVTLSWSAPGSNGGAMIDYYLVYVDGVALTDHYSTTTATVTGLANDRSYSFTTGAHNAAGIGPLSSPAIAKPSATTTVPGAPIGLMAMHGDGQVTLSWSAPGSNGGAMIDYYLVYVDGVALTDHYSTTTATVTGLANGHSYVFTVSAHNIVGYGLRSDAVTSAPSVTLTVPDIPTGLTAVPEDGQVFLSWAPPDGNGGAMIDYYVVYQNGTEIAHADSLSITVSDLTNGISYSFSVAAHNTVGSGARSSIVPATPSATIAVPGHPISLTATPGDGQVVLSWTAPGSNGGASVDYYMVYVEGTERIDHYVENHAIISGLANGQPYNFTVAAHNSVGVGPQSSKVTVVPSTTLTVPGAPIDLTVTLEDGWVSLSWVTPASNGGAEIDYYAICQDGYDIYHVTANSKTVGGLTAGRSYNFTVSAHNSVGMGGNTSSVIAIPPSTSESPGIPANLMIAVEDGLVTISWTAPDSQSGPPIDYYVVYQNGVDIIHPVGNVTSITGLTNGVSYEFTVSAHNSVGMGGKTSPVTAMLVSRAEPPGTPTKLAITPGNGTLTISWAFPAKSGTFDIDYFVVYQNGVDAAHSVGNQTTITGLTNGVNYTIEIAAHSPAGLGNQSVAITAAPVGPSSSETDTASPTTRYAGEDIVNNIGAIVLLMAAIFGIVFVVWRFKKKV